MKKVKCMLCACLAVFAMSTLFGCTEPAPDPDVGGVVGGIGGNDVIPDYDFDYIPHYSDQFDINDYPEDTGEKHPFRMEAENANFFGVSGGSEADPGLYEALSYHYNPGLSNGLAVKNFTPDGYQSTNRYVFEFESDKTCRVKMNVRMAADTDGKDKKFKACYDVSFNKHEALSDPTVEAASATPLPINPSKYFNMTTVAIDIVVFEGKNTVVFAPRSYTPGNLDYAELETSADITGFEKRWMEESAQWNVTKEPTETSTGVLTVSSANQKTATFELPSLTTGNIYTKAVESGVTKYTFEVRGKTFVFEIGKESTLTLHNGLTFKDDGSTEKKFVSGTSLKLGEIIEYTGEGTADGYYDVEKNLMIDADFVMPSNDITVGVIVKKEGDLEFALRNPDDLDKDASDCYGDKTDGLDNPKKQRNIIVNGRRATRLQITSGIVKDSHVRLFTRAKDTPLGAISKDVTYKATYTIRNFAAESISFRIYQLNRKGEETGAAKDFFADFEIAAGAEQTREITFKLSGNNDNLTSYFFFGEGFESLDIAVAFNVVKVK